MSLNPESVLLTDRVAVVTGAGSGIGRGIARGFTGFGAQVAIWESDPDTCAAAAEEIGALGIVTDVREASEVDAALARTTEELGPVDILVNNAGGVFNSPLLETSENGWDALYRSNLKHVILCTQRVARVMVERGIGGSIISVTSIEGVRAAPGYAAYAAAKAGVINYTKTAALELAPHGIRVNALAPDITMTEGMAQVAPPEAVRVHGAHGPRRARRRDGRCRRLPGQRPVELRHGPDDPRRRRDARGERLVSPSRDGCLLLGAATRLLGAGIRRTAGRGRSGAAVSPRRASPRAPTCLRPRRSSAR
jgi:3-oxoacyl-[acyl-carrier protein] reductase